MESAEGFAKRLQSERGLKLVIECKKSVAASAVDGVPDDAGRLSVKLLYIGAAGGSAGKDPIIESDSHSYRMLCSPCSFTPDEKIVYGLYRSPDGGLWMCWYCKAYIKDPDIFENGFELRFFVPDALAARAPQFTVKCNGEELLSMQLDSPGEKKVTVDVCQADKALREYLRTVRRHQQLLLDEIARVCEKYGLRYYACYGTLLGAVRGSDIVPWDDDIDICMPRKDFDILVEKSGEEWTEGSDFALLRPDGYGSDFFLDFMTRLVYMKEEIKGDPFSRIPEGLPWHRHLPLDIYTLDNASDDEKTHARRAARLRLLYALGLSRRKGFTEKGHEHLGAKVLLGSKILRTAGKAVPLKTLMRSYEKTVRSAGSDTNHYFMSNGYYLCYGYRYPVRYFVGQRRACLGDISVPVPPMAEELLKDTYGEYLKYPDLWLRRPDHYPGPDDFSDFS